ncbi:MAG: MaoC family dehydratase [Chloroflexota bacterium]|nr:MAG: MaoC family dehydratase [Chloroflexota bacterium]
MRARITKTFTDADVTLFSGLVGDFGPLHVDAEYARKTRFGRRTAHEMLAGGLIFAVLSAELPGPGSVCLSLQMEFLAPMYIGDTITAEVEIDSWMPEKRLVTLKIACVNQENQQIITGQAVLLVPFREERVDSPMGI